MIERSMNIDNAEKFCKYLLTHQINKPIGNAILSLIGSIQASRLKDTSLVKLYLPDDTFNKLTNYLSSINKGEMQMVERSVQGNWQLFLDELTDDPDIPF
ncbi:hypothetical protein DSM106972_025580 [Dulcicalothrix desertica PCC 7102]|uniref:Uncharacterized protein n=1 Tax=Dulcicalothrix desertica PCC 7102 TaxID=232991 RepID=A0A3S1ANV5_9CYAN|nr:hypothetical protein [Dulcicalothrix desertica]RUT07297.1 hypothetical protein DSM106972_025580 [Dulcicalothrix desertica PCC 7102]TWH62111.1 hypothetical protein CAL7102_00808 [Dulcicalothrix desertica PCC 7102]